MCITSNAFNNRIHILFWQILSVVSDEFEAHPDNGLKFRRAVSDFCSRVMGRRIKLAVTKMAGLFSQLHDAMLNVQKQHKQSESPVVRTVPWAPHPARRLPHRGRPMRYSNTYDPPNRARVNTF